MLGAKTRQLNGNFLYPGGVTDNQLRTLNHLGFFTPALNESVISNYTSLVNVTNTSASLELRSRSYFDANCAHCHRPGGVDALFDMRFDTPLASQGLINGYATATLGISGAKIICPGSTNQSVAFQRADSLGTIEMPPLAKNVVDTNAMAVVAAWITSLSPQFTTLPPPWADADLGLALPGGATYTNGLFSVTGSGDDLWSTADDGHLVFEPIIGSGQIVARVSAVQYTDPWAKAGIIFRETPDAGARDVVMAVTGGQGTFFESRTNTGGQCSGVFGPDYGAPYWVKLVRAGDVFTGYTSPDSMNWTLVASLTNVMNSAIEVGMVVTAHDPVLFNLSTFNNVSLVFSNGQPLYITTAATPGTAASTGENVQFSLQKFAGQAGQSVSTTANQAGTITAQGQNTPAGEVAANAFDGNTATKWLDFATNNPSTRASWIQYAYANGAQCVVTQYTVASANDEPERDPANWRFLGSNDGGLTWATLDTRTGQTFASRYQTLSFSVANSVAYNIYRFQIDSVANPSTANSVQLSELQFIGPAGLNYSWSFGDGTAATGQNPAHTYTASGTYTVTAVAYDGVSYATNILTMAVTLPAPALQWLPATATMSNHVFHINAQVVAGSNYVIEATTNFKAWTPVLTNMPAGGLLMFTDTATTNFRYRFYRVHTQ